MLHLKIAQDFETGVVRQWRLLAPTAESLRLRLFKGASTAVIGAVGGWGAVVMLGAVLMSGARHEAPPAAPALAAVVAPAPAAPAPAPAPVAALTRAAAPVSAAPAPAKVTQRIDMTPTAAIVEPPKPHHKPHKKKTKDLDKAN